MKVLRYAMTMGCLFLAIMVRGDVWTDPATGLTWKYTSNGESSTLGIEKYRSYETALPTSTAGAVEIPSTLGSCPVTRVGKNAFSGCSGLTSVGLPSCITQIGFGAFSGCSELTAVEIPSKVSIIDQATFAKCSKLVTITIPSNVTTIGVYAFSDCKGLKSVSIQDGVTGIGNYAFENCSGLTSITIPRSVTTIGECSFHESGLLAVTLPNHLTSMGQGAFECCRALKSVVVEDGVKSIGPAAFEYCTALTTVSIPMSVTSIREWAFEYCSGLKTVVLPTGITSIGEKVFANSGLTTISIPFGVTNIPKGCFSKCRELVSVEMQDGVSSIGAEAFQYCSGLCSIVIPAGVTTIGEDAFLGSGLTSVLIPASVESIGDDAFSCPALTSIAVEEDNPKYSSCEGVLYQKDADMIVRCPCGYIGVIDIPFGIKCVGEGAFSSCRYLTSVVIPSSVDSIGRESFGGCWNLESISIPTSVTNIGSYAFGGCLGLKTVYVDEGYGGDGGAIGDLLRLSGLDTTNITFKQRVYVVSLSPMGGNVETNLLALAAKSDTGDICVGALPIPTRKDHDFLGWYTEVDGGSEVTSETRINADIQLYAHWNVHVDGFVISNGLLISYDYKNATEVFIPSQAVWIADNVFANRPLLKSVVFSGSLLEIGLGCFSNDYCLDNIVVPDSVEYNFPNVVVLYAA